MQQIFSQQKLKIPQDLPFPYAHIDMILNILV